MSEDQNPRKWSFDDSKLLKGMHLNPLETVELLEAQLRMLEASDKLSKILIRLMATKFGAKKIEGEPPSRSTNSQSAIDDLLRGISGEGEVVSILCLTTDHQMELIEAIDSLQNSLEILSTDLIAYPKLELIHHKARLAVRFAILMAAMEPKPIKEMPRHGDNLAEDLAQETTEEDRAQ